MPHFAYVLTVVVIYQHYSEGLPTKIKMCDVITNFYVDRKFGEKVRSL